MRPAPLALLALASCARLTLPVGEAPPKDVPAGLFGATLGPVVVRDLSNAGWNFTDERDGDRIFALATPGGGVREAEATVRDGAVVLLRARYVETRLTAYEALVKSLVERHGPPQQSLETNDFPLLARDLASDRPPPTHYVVHRWRGAQSQLLLAAGVEVRENLLSHMDYQLFLVPPHEPMPIVER